MKEIAKWGIYEISLEGPQDGNPFIDVELKAEFSYANRVVTARGFYDGDGVYKVRFMPDKEGSWKVKTFSNVSKLNGIEDAFVCTQPEKDSHGIVRTVDRAHFVYDDGKNYYPFGTTSYVWIYQPQEVQDRTIESLKKSPFNKIRMCVFPKYYDYNTRTPEMYPYEGKPELESIDVFKNELWMTPAKGFDFSRFNTKFFQKLEEQIKSLDEIGVEADVILFHPYDRWGFSRMTKEEDLRYLRYIVARLASFKNVWWSLANEYELMYEFGQKEEERWDDLFKCIKEEDYAGHLASIHNWHNPPIHFGGNRQWYDHNKTWVDHACIQHYDMYTLQKWLKQYHKPIIVDECRYEGNIDWGWGNLSAQHMTKQFWEAVCQGAYAGHGETYFNDDGYIWWSHGGTLKGESIERIAFLRKILEDNQYRLYPLCDENPHWEARMSIAENGDVMAYLGADSQPSYKIIRELPDGAVYSGELIDTWNMTVEKIDYLIDNTTRIELPSKTCMALRLVKVSE